MLRSKLTTLRVSAAIVGLAAALALSASPAVAAGPPGCPGCEPVPGATYVGTWQTIDRQVSGGFSITLMAGQPFRVASFTVSDLPWDACIPDPVHGLSYCVSTGDPAVCGSSFVKSYPNGLKMYPDAAGYWNFGFSHGQDPYDPHIRGETNDNDSLGLGSSPLARGMYGSVSPEKLGSGGEQCYVLADLPLYWAAETKVGTSGNKKKCKKKQEGKQGAVAAKKKRKCKKRKKK